MKSKQGGFTLIELIVVIVVLGILAATAIPRFSNLTTEARIATVRGMEGAIRSAAAIVYAQSLVEGEAGAAVGVGEDVLLEGQAIATDFGYPATAAICLAVPLGGANMSCVAGVFQRTDATTPATCQVAYTQPGAINTQPTINVTVTNCN